MTKEGTGMKAGREKWETEWKETSDEREMTQEYKSDGDE